MADNEEFMRAFREADQVDALRYLIEGLREFAPRPQWVLQPKHPVGWQLVRLEPARERGPRFLFSVRLTTGQMIQPEEAMEMLEIIREMFQETFAASVDFVDVEPELAPYPRPPYDPSRITYRDARRPW